MPRTTLNLDAPILRELKRLQGREGKTLGQVVSELLARALSGESKPAPRAAFRWRSRRMEALVDLEDREALYALLDQRDRLDEVADRD
jgi:hypothetical protein